MASIRDVKFIDAKKRHYPRKHYAYVIAVTYNDSTVCVIRRRYSQFFDFQCTLLDKYPDEAGANKDQKRIIPFLPGKILFGRSQIRDVALKRMSTLEEYCKLVIALPEHISQSDVVLEFFRPTNSEINDTDNEQIDNVSVTSISEPWQPEQLRVLMNYTPKSKRELELEKGMIVEAIEKNESGWWLVRSDEQFGWVPGSFLESHDPNGEISLRRTDRNQYVTTESYVAKNLDELSFVRGVIMEVLDKNTSGWWLARNKGKKGLVPGVYLKRFDAKLTPHEHRKKRESSSGKTHQRKAVSSQHVESVGNLPEKSYKRCRTLSSFRSASPGCVQFAAGQDVQVLNEDPSGWWYLLVNGRRGWAPSTYLAPLLDESNRTYGSQIQIDSGRNCETSDQRKVTKQVRVNERIKQFEKFSKS